MAGYLRTLRRKWPVPTTRPNTIYDLAGAGVLLVATAVLLLVARWQFRRTDLDG